MFRPPSIRALATAFPDLLSPEEIVALAEGLLLKVTEMGEQPDQPLPPNLAEMQRIALAGLMAMAQAKSLRYESPVLGPGEANGWGVPAAAERGDVSKRTEPAAPPVATIPDPTMETAAAGPGAAGAQSAVVAQPPVIVTLASLLGSAAPR